MGFREKFKTFAACMSNVDLSVAIKEDAADTIVKLSPVCALFLEIITHSKDDDISDLLGDYYLNESLTDFTICTQDGDVLAFRIQYNATSHKYWLWNVRTNTWQWMNISNSTTGKLLFDIDEEVIGTPNGEYLWSLYQISQSLCSQLQSCTVIERLAGLGCGDSVSISDVMASLRDLEGKFTPEVGVFLGKLSSLGSRLTPSSLVNGLRSMMASVSTASADDDSIEFDTTDWSLKSFNGTVVRDLILSGVQMLGTVLLYAGSIFLKMAGAAAYIATAVVPGILQTAGVTETATWNGSATQYEYAVPIKQGYFSNADVDVDLLNYVRDNRLIKILAPFGNVYLWYNSTDTAHIYYALYLNLNMCGNFATQETVNASFFRVMNWNIDDVNKIGHVNIAIDGDFIDASHNIFPYNEYTGFFNSAPKPQFYGMMDDSSDSSMLYRVCMALLPLALHAMQAALAFTGTADDYDEFGYNVLPNITWSGTFGWDYAYREYVQGFANTSYSEVDRLGCLAAALSAVGLYGGLGGQIGPTWTWINNTVIASLNSFASIPVLLRALCLEPSSTSGLVSACGAVMQCSSFRGSFAITPPTYAKGSALAAFLTALLAAAVIVTTAMIVKTVWSRKMSAVMTDRYVGVQEKFDLMKQARGTPQYAQAKKDYLKSVRKYNILARFTGYSTLSAVQGWETGNSTSVNSSNGFSDSAVVQDIKDSILGVNSDESVDDFSLLDVKKLIVGP